MNGMKWTRCDLAAFEVDFWCHFLLVNTSLMPSPETTKVHGRRKSYWRSDCTWSLCQRRDEFFISVFIYYWQETSLPPLFRVKMWLLLQPRYITAEYASMKPENCAVHCSLIPFYFHYAAWSTTSQPRGLSNQLSHHSGRLVGADV